MRFSHFLRANNVVGTIPPVAEWRDIWECYKTALTKFLGALSMRSRPQPVAREVPRPTRLHQPSSAQMFRRALEALASDTEAGLFDDEDY